MKKNIFCLLLITFLIALAPLVWGQSLSVTLTWSTDTYVPADYPGQALPSRGSMVEVAAEIDSGRTDPQKLIYNWYLNGDIQPDDSGLGKQTFKFKASERVGEIHLVEAEISNDKEEIIGRSQRLPIKTVEPQIIVSLLRPRLELLQLSDLLTNKFQLPSEQETKFIARPYFFNIISPEELNYDWKFGAEKIPQSETKNPNIFNLKVGKVINPIVRFLNLFAENKKNLIQRSQAEMEITIKP